MKVLIKYETDLTRAVMLAKDEAYRIGFSKTESFMIATAVSELARNVLIYAKTGEILLNSIMKNKQFGIEIIVQDQGPGIKEIEKAMEDHQSSNGTLGLGLPGAKRLMDEFEISSTIGEGTVIKAKKWMK